MKCDEYSPKDGDLADTKRVCCLNAELKAEDVLKLINRDKQKVCAYDHPKLLFSIISYITG